MSTVGNECDVLIEGGKLKCGCPWFYVPDYPDEGHQPRHVDGCPEPIRQLLYRAVNLVARDAWGSSGQVVSFAAWDRGHLDNDTYDEWLRQAATLVKDETNHDEYGGIDRALVVLPGLLGESEADGV